MVHNKTNSINPVKMWAGILEQGKRKYIDDVHLCKQDALVFYECVIPVMVVPLSLDHDQAMLNMEVCTNETNKLARSAGLRKLKLMQPKEVMTSMAKKKPKKPKAGMSCK